MQSLVPYKFGFRNSLIILLSTTLPFFSIGCQTTRQSNPAITTLSTELEEANQKIEEIYHRLSVVQFMVDNHQRTLTELEAKLSGDTTSLSQKRGDKLSMKKDSDGTGTDTLSQPDVVEVEIDSDTQQPDASESKQDPTVVPVVTDETKSPVSPSTSKDSAEYLYNQGFSSLKNKNYTKAISLFKSVVAKYPDHDLADNAIYWTGEIHYTQQEYPAAILTFQRLIEKYPEGSKVPDALLKTGYAYYAMSDFNNARKFLKKVVVDYPFTYSGNKAEEMLKRIAKH